MNSSANPNPTAAAPPAGKSQDSLPAKAVAWARQNLFNNWQSSLITVVLGALAVWLGLRGLRFLLFTSNWAPVRTNLTLLMVGTFPRDEQWRIVVQLLLLATAVGLFWGAAISAAKQRAQQAGLEFSVEPIWKVAKRWWALLMFLVILVVPGKAWNFVLTVLFGKYGLRGLTETWLPLADRWFQSSGAGNGFRGLTETWLPLLITVAAIMIIFTLREIVRRVSNILRSLSWVLGYVLSVAAWQVVSGTGGSGWWWLAGLLAYLAVRLVNQLRDRYPNNLLLADNLYRLGLTLVAIAVATTAAWLLYIPLTTPETLAGIGWDKWSGFHLNLVATAIAIVAAFPLGMLLALGRRSKLPVIKWLSVTYIELVRGVPLIGLLFVGNTIVGHFIDFSHNIDNSVFFFDWFDWLFEFFRDTSSPLSQISRAIAVMTIFTSAYLAEIIRGGLASLSRGQLEAGQAIGLSATQNTRLILLPQAITAVIPSLVGQFISLLKDSTLLSVIAVLEILRARYNLHQQPAFTSLGVAETLVFIGFAFWAVAYTMSIESQRLEKKLGVGTR